MFLADFGKQKENKQIKGHYRKNKDGKLSFVRNHLRGMLIGSAGLAGTATILGLALRKKNKLRKIIVKNMEEQVPKNIKVNSPIEKVVENKTIRNAADFERVKNIYDKQLSLTDKKYYKDVFGDENIVAFTTGYQLYGKVGSRPGYQTRMVLNKNNTIDPGDNRFTQNTDEIKDFSGEYIYGASEGYNVDNYHPYLHVVKNNANNTYHVNYGGQTGNYKDSGGDTGRETLVGYKFVIPNTKDNEQLIQNMYDDLQLYRRGEPSLIETYMANTEKRKKSPLGGLEMIIDDNAMRDFINKLRNNTYNKPSFNPIDDDEIYSHVISDYKAGYNLKKPNENKRYDKPFRE